VEEVVALPAGNLEADETEAFSRDNGLLAFAAHDYRLQFHSSPPQLALPYSTAIALRFQILMGFLYTSSLKSRALEEHFNHPTLRMRGFTARRERPDPY
jgi:hypothetical protein